MFIENDVNSTGQCLFSHVTFDDTLSLIAGGPVFKECRICHKDILSVM